MDELTPTMGATGSEVIIAMPPPVGRHVTGGAAMRLIPLVTLLSSLGLVAVLFASGSGLARNPVSLLFPLTMVGSSIAAVLAGSTGRRQTAELNADRESYLAYLREMSCRVADTAEAQRVRLRHRYPEPSALWTLVAGPRRWECRRSDPGFGRVRIGIGEIAAQARPVAEATAGAAEIDPVTAAALDRFLTAGARVGGAPVSVSFKGSRWIVDGDGDGDGARGLVRAIICGLAVLHSPRDLMVSAVVDTATRSHWDWLKWLPHNQHPDTCDDLGPLRMVYPRSADAVTLDAEGRWLVVIVDSSDESRGPIATELPTGDHVTVVQLATDSAAASAPPPTLRLIADRLVTGLDADGTEITARADTLTLHEALACARRLAAYRPPQPDRAGPGSWLDQVGVRDPADIDVDRMWRTKGVAPLPVPIGTGEHNARVELDISEAALGGMGPHGLCVGATGSGKSELLRSIALGMICRHSPDDVNLILVDFKGGATFLGFERAHHVAAVITNLAEEAYLVDRMRDALNGEITRRQRILRAAGNFTGIAQYRARAVGAVLPALPTLFVIVDEFSELLTQQPDFIDVFVAIGRLGRSLGIHLLLASQRLDEGRLRGLDSHLSYRICLKTLSANESRAAIGVPDAYHLPAAPGAAYLKVGSAEPARFQGAFVSGPTGSPAIAAEHRSAPQRVEEFSTIPRGRVVNAGIPPADHTASSTVLDVLLDGIAGRGTQSHRVWLPPQHHSPTLQ